ncbi:GPW/gp25 family protein [Microscilla marina]|uniref:Phage baseplate assembly protein W n=1 Tax=Microscilla marina ATCC 23134 TaxID=313606 RepID=A1ZX20_MICM2|nr:GPW/gp25 family protein [Microscilla marina]EAY25100.1 phage baseplate assembly protein W [Microscilla marina ATCC 23134]
MKHKKTFLGIGWAFPPTFDKRIKSVEMVSEEEDIRQSLFVLLSTKQGERIIYPDYGSDIQSMIFEPIDVNTTTYLKETIRRAVLNFEPRISLDEVNVEQDSEEEGLLLVTLVYTIRKTNTRTNMVYPYYIIEGTDL